MNGSKFKSLSVRRESVRPMVTLTLRPSPSDLRAQVYSVPVSCRLVGIPRSRATGLVDCRCGVWEREQEQAQEAHKHKPLPLPLQGLARSRPSPCPQRAPYGPSQTKRKPRPLTGVCHRTPRQDLGPSEAVALRATIRVAGDPAGPPPTSTTSKNMWLVCSVPNPS
jgi:hypothetical protein